MTKKLRKIDMITDQDYKEWKNWKEETRKEEYRRRNPKLMKI